MNSMIGGTLKLFKLIFSLLITFYSCQSKKEEIKQTFVLFNQQKPFEILSFEKNNDYPSSENDTSMCQSWELNKSEIKKVFAESRAINGPEWHHLFGVLPCQIIGTISQNDQQYEFSINSGAWVTVSSSDTTLLFGNFEKANNKYFLMEALEENE